MNLNMTLKAAWQADGSLNGVLPVDRLYFEELQEEDRKEDRPEFPFVVWQEIDDSPLEATSEAWYDEVTYNLVVYAETKEELKAILRESRRVLRSIPVDSFQDDEGAVVLFEKRGGSQELGDGGVYSAVDEYAVMRQRSR